jgi:hypothetical protein
MANRLFQVQQLDECWAHDDIYAVSMQNAANQIVSLKTGIKNWGDGSFPHATKLGIITRSSPLKVIKIRCYK